MARHPHRERMRRSVTKLRRQRSVQDAGAVCAASILRGKRRRNSGEDAQELAAGFHGRPPAGRTQVTDTVTVERELVQLGYGLAAIYLLDEQGRCSCPQRGHKSGAPYIEFDPQRTKLASNVKRKNGSVCATQLYVVGPDQDIDLRAFGLKDTGKAEYDLGLVGAVEYLAAKHHLEAADKLRGPYIHHFDRGHQPQLNFRPADHELKFIGGRYLIELDMDGGKTSAGIKH